MPYSGNCEDFNGEHGTYLFGKCISISVVCLCLLASTAVSNFLWHIKYVSLNLRGKYGYPLFTGGET